MNNRELEKLIELALKGGLDERKEARLLQYFENNPAEQSRIEEDIILGRLLKNLPSIPVSSNFTARVMEAIGKEEAVEEIPVSPQSIFSYILHNIVPKFVSICLMLALIGLGYFSYSESKRVKLAGSIAELERVAMLGDKESGLPVEIFKDFDVIQNINTYNSFVDVELLAALKNNN